MKAVILAAGLGTRLGKLTATCPKPMLPILGRPLLEHTVGWLRAHGVRDIGVNLHHHPEQIAPYFGDGARLGVHIRYSYEASLLGTAGAVRRFADMLDERFLVVYGDVLTDQDLRGLEGFHSRHHAVLTMSLYHVDDPTRAGIVRVDLTGRVVRFVEKPSCDAIFSDLANAGVLIAEPAILDTIPGERASDIGHDVIPSLLRQQAGVYGCTADGYVLDIGDPERYLQAQRDAWLGHVHLYHDEALGADGGQAPEAAGHVAKRAARC